MPTKPLKFANAVLAFAAELTLAFLWKNLPRRSGQQRAQPPCVTVDLDRLNQK